MKIKLLRYTPRKVKETLITLKVGISTINITLEEIYLNSYVIHVMKEDTLPKIVLETKIDLTRRREKREDIMLMLQRMLKPSTKRIR